MAQHARCCLPSFGTTSDGPKRSVSIRARTTPSQNTKLLSAYDQGELDALLKAAWGLLLHRYTGLEDVCFGFQVFGVDDLHSRLSSSNSRNPLPCRLNINEDDSILSIVRRAAGKDDPEDNATLNKGSDPDRDGHSEFNTTIMVRICRTYSNGYRGNSVPPALPITLPEECRVRLHVKVLQEDICIFLEWWNNEISAAQMESLTCYFENLLDQVLCMEDTPTTELHSFLGSDWDRICKINSVLPEAYERCIQDVIKEQALSHPQEEAVCSWDGSFTYAELDHLASKLAYHLQSHGVSPEIRVALCFDKSKWNIVAMLGVLKAGGAFVPLDPTHPTSRLRSLVQSVNGTIMLCSRNRAERLSTVVDVLIPLDDDLLNEITLPPGDVIQARVNPRNAAYLIFTSGSTGQPKGTLLEHAAFVSSAMAHAPPMDVNADCRILQFAAHTFDASLFESLTPLVHGGCVCIPSDEERLNDVVQAINRMRVNVACLTPSFVKFVDPSKVPRLKTLVLAGEAMSRSHLEAWSNITLVNGYGPTESAICASVNRNINLTSDCRDIGFPTGVRFWIVNPRNHDQLVPVGSPGELLLEGPTLARCYVNNKEKTDEVFIYNPAWTRNIAGSSDRRFYKTGDLVRYNSDAGSLTFIGRKDTQIKLHGQRIELGEIENNLSSLANIKHSLAFLSDSGFAKGRMVAVVSGHGEFSSEDKALKLWDRSKTPTIVQEFRDQLSSRLPTYMIPAVWLCVDSLPLLPSGKLNRKAIVRWVTSMLEDPDKQVNTSNPPPNANDTPPEDTIEDRLMSIWSRVLNLPKKQIGYDQGFLSLGGDSIAAITCMGFCKKQGMGITVQEVLQSKSIKDLAAHVKEVSQPMVHEEATDKPFGLSPIQKLHFMVRSEGQGYFNQGIRTRLNQRVTEHDLRCAVEKIIQRHSMLRARLIDNGPQGLLEQCITQDVAGSYRWRTHNIREEVEMEPAIAESQLSINAFKGPILSVDLFQVNGEDCLLSLVAHHLVVDIVSWRIILEDLEEFLLSPDEHQTSASSLPFPTWCHLQGQQTQALIPRTSRDLDDLLPPNFAYWGMENRISTYGDATCETFEINPEDTRSILMGCHKSLQTEPIDVLLASLLHSFGQTFKDRALPVIYNEGHGREVWDSTIDISRTVGWFTTVFPISMPELIENDPVETVIRIKDLRRRAVDNGRQDFASCVSATGENGKSLHPHPMEITFNYVGQHRDLQRQDGLFQLMNQMAGETGQGGGASDFGEDTPRFALFEISALAVNGKLRFIFSFNKHMQHQEAIRSWIASCGDLLKALGQRLQSLPPKPTLSSFPMLSLTYQELDKIVSNKLPSVGISSLDLIEDIYPCSRMQQGILLARSRDSSLYAVHDTYEVTGLGNAPDATKLVEAWQLVISRHAMLRTLFVDNLSSQDLFCQVVLKTFNSSPVHLRCTDDRDVLETFDSQQPAAYTQSQPHHQLTICETATGKLFFRIELSHAVMDGVSVSIILRDLRLAYDGKVDGSRPLFSKYVQYLRGLSQATTGSMDYWRVYLQGIKPCIFPVLTDGKAVPHKQLRTMRLNFNSYKQLQAICEKNGLTLSTAFSTAWGLTLRLFCNTNDICFSYMTSLRDAPVQDIESVVGPIINLLAFRMKVSEDHSLKEIMLRLQDDYMQGLPHKTLSLIDIQHELKLSDTSLLNTGLSYQKVSSQSTTSTGSIHLAKVGTIQDPAEFPVFVNVEAADRDASIELNYWTNTLSDEQAKNVASTFLKYLQDIILSHEKPLGQVEILSDWSKKRIRKWNKQHIEGVDLSVHEVLREKADAYPDKPAITSRDETLTYWKLDELSSRLAVYLTQLGVGTGTPVPVHISRSIWQVVAILAVLRAGGICVPRTDSHSDDQLDQWLADNGANLVLASSSNARLLEGKIPLVISVNESLFEFLPHSSEASFNQIDSSNEAYVVFTSDGSHSARAVVLDHQAILTRADAFASALNMNSKTRVFQFAPFTTDIFLQELFATIMRGGCLCIPDSDDPSQLAMSMNSSKANLANLTPSLASIVQPSNVPEIQVISLFGEPVTKDVREAWTEKVQLHSFHGAAESSSTCIHHPRVDKSDELPNIGSSAGCYSWLVDPLNPARLVPVGCVGELVVEGPGVCRGYLCGEELTRENFIKDPIWATGGSEKAYSLFSRSSRQMFKTGDLVRYNSDGTMVYLGRKEDIINAKTQITASEIEQHLDSLPLSGYRFIVEKVDVGDEQDSTQSLAVFVLRKTGQPTLDEEKSIISPKTCAFHDIMAKLHAFLLNKLPASQVPSLYLDIQGFPLTPLGTVNRPLLRNAVKTLPESSRLEFDIKRFGEFWRLELEKPSLSDGFLSHPRPARGASALKLMDKSLTVSWGESLQPSEIKSTLLCALALTMHTYAQCEDIVLADLLFDDQATIVPRRIRVDKTCTIGETLEQARSSLERAKPFQKASFRWVKNLNADTTRACSVQTLLSVSDMIIEEQDECLKRLESAAETQDEPHMHPLVVSCAIHDKGLQIRARYDDMALYSSQVERLIALFAEIFELIRSNAGLQEKVCDLGKRSASLHAFNADVSFWKDRLTDVEPCLFPSLSLKNGEENKFSSERLQITNAPQIQSACERLGVTPNALFQMVWGLVLRCYTGLEAVCFGHYVSTEDSSLQTEAGKPQNGVFPCRFTLNDDMKILDILEREKMNFDQMMNRQLPLYEIQQVAGLGDSPIFNTAFRYSNLSATPTEFNNPASSLPIEELNKYIIIVNAHVSGSSGEIIFEYLSTSLSISDIGSIIDCFEHTLNSVVELLGASHLIRDIEFLGSQSCQKIRNWNASLPDRPKKCAHEIIHERVTANPSAPAICSWDGDFTYAELDLLSTKLGYYLMNRGVGPEVFIGLCFEKSAWAVIAQVAVLKAGGAFASLDPSHPETRLKGLVDDINAPIILCSTKYLEKVSRVCEVAMAVGASGIAQMTDLSLSPKPASSTPRVDNAAYAIFTSGTTGKPKVTVLEHVSLGIASSSFAHALGMDSETRALQFSSYTFDVSVLETIIVLMIGGCVCIPSDEERLNDLAGAIQRTRANFSSITPALISTLDPKRVPTLKTIITGGEKLSESHMARWTDRRFINAYGPSEATIIATSSLKLDGTGVRLDDDSGSIGTAITGRAWIVDPHNHHRLLPIGAVGELVLEGCNVARGYLNNDKKTKESFITQPPWCQLPGLQGVFQRSERMYRTGDLVRYKSDGNICFISRMDTQIKLNGQRIELEEIEQQCALSLGADAQVAVDIVVPETKTVAKGLAAFFTVDTQDAQQKAGNSSHLLLPASELTGITIKKLHGSLCQVLPQLMVPKYYFPVRYLPIGNTGKLDRKGLRALVQGCSKEELKPYMISNSITGQALEKEMKSTLRNLWAEVLELEPGSISAEDTFFGLGGDSFSAMKLVGIARAQGISLSVADIYEHPCLVDMEKRCETGVEPSQNATLEPFSLVPSSLSLANILEEVSNQCCVSEQSISDIYPCSAVQEGLLTLSIQHRGAYIARPIFQLAANIDIVKFKSSWQQAVDEFDILRTRIVHTEAAGFLQVVLKKERISWTVETTFDDLMKDTLDSNGGLLNKYTIVQPGPSSTRYFVWVVHHALYDGWSIPQMLERVENIYSGSSTQHSAVPYSLFINHLLKHDPSESDEFWKHQLADLSSVPFPAQHHSESNAARVGNRQCTTLDISQTFKGADITVPEIIRAAWAIIISVHTGSGDVCFGETLMGRNIDLPGITDVAGPVLTTVPMRIKVDNRLPITKYLYEVRQLTAAMIPHQHAGLQRIQKLSPDAALACEFRNLLVIQSDDAELKKSIWTAENNQTNGEFFTHPLVVECKVSGSKLMIQAHHDELILNTWQAERLVGQFSFVLEQLFNLHQESTVKVDDLHISSPLDKADITIWNQRNPPCVDKCAHEIIQEQALIQPGAPAICSWDGELCYEEMFNLASSFGAYLTSCGIGPETFVPVCLDKSVWAVVTILGILIAGGGFVPLDPSHPTSRHKEVLEETNATVILCSPQYRSRYLGSIDTIIPVSKETIRAYNAIKTTTRAFTGPNPTNMAYAIFTSGSTGRAKGIIIDHRALSSSAMAFGPIVHLNKDARAFQFASLTFDAAVMEVLATLMHGGCICIPNEEERLNDIAGAMRRMNVSWAFLTPSIASILEPSALPSLKVLSCGGEKLSREVVTKWAHRVKLINGYGPTETTIFAVLNTDFTNHEFSCIGHGIPSTLTWIVDPDNHDRLTPLGAVGELALEGAALAREYLKNPKKTAEAFITEPAWMKDFSSPLPSPRRIYKTGDLVKYNPDGSIEYIGRKDHQVKLNGQRMELGEIEHRLYGDQRVRHAVVILPQAGPLQKKLVAVLSLNSLPADSSIISSSTCDLISQKDMIGIGHPETSLIKKSLETQLPIYMVPQAWAVVKNVPMLVSGKLDRKRITGWVEQLEAPAYDHIMQDYAEMSLENIEHEDKDSEGSVLDTLQDVFAQVLNLPKHMIDPNRSFINLGGDSITGMAVISKARKHGLNLALHRVLQTKSMNELAQSCDVGTKLIEMKHKSESSTPFRLSPIQELFFRSAQVVPKASARFNQSITVRTTREIRPQVIEDAVRAVVRKHSMFRARLSKSRDGTWQQRITDDANSSHKFRTHAVKDSHEILGKVADSQCRLDIESGPVFIADLFALQDGQQILCLVASHLVVDMVSWRIVLQDIEEFVDNGVLSSLETPLPFQSWCNLQIENIKDKDDTQISFDSPRLDYWGKALADNNYGHVKMETLTLDEATTSFILRECHEVLRTETVELLLAAVIHSFSQVFTDREVPAIYNEGHGRETWDSSIDPSRTVGWFTTLSPVHVGRTSDFLNMVKRVKDTRRQTAGNSRSFFARNVLCSGQNQETDRFPVPLEVIFNYLGQLQQLERDESLFKHYGDAFNAEAFEIAGDMGPETPRFALFEISALVIKERLHMSFTYNRNMRHETQIREWVFRCKQTLETDLLGFRDFAPEPTLSDYPLLPITYDGLEHLTKNTLPNMGIVGLDQIEDIYPCSPVQEGILFSQLRDSDEYIFNAVFEVQHAGNGNIDLARLQEAWSAVVSRHSILRTVFVDSSCKGASFDQAVLHKINDQVTLIECDDSDASHRLDAISIQKTNAERHSNLCHQLVICKTSVGRVLLKVEMNHAIIDGGSMDILLRDLVLAYSNQLPPGTGPRFSDYIKYLRGESQDEALSYWRRHLKGILPCHLPVVTGQSGPRQLGSFMMAFDRFSELQRFCENHSMTLANLTLAAWAIVLRSYTGSDDICFGYPSTGRDSPVPGIQDAVGIFINMLCCRVKFTTGQSFLDVSKAVQDDYIRALPHQSCSLAQIQHELSAQGKPLFNTTISIQNHSASNNEATEISLKFQKAHDPTEYPITVNVETARGREGVLLRYWTNSVSETEASKLANAIARVFTSFVEDPSRPISELSLHSKESLAHTPRPQDTIRSTGGLEIAEQPIDNNYLESIIDSRIKVIINQMLKEGKLDTSWVKDRDMSLSNDSLPLESEFQASIRGCVVSKEKSPSDSTQTLTEDYRMPTDSEKSLWRLWSMTLGLPPHPVKHHDSFFKLGGDSITAMKLVGAAREEGIMLTVGDVFRTPVFEDMLAMVNSKAKPLVSHVREKSANGVEELNEKISLTMSDSSPEITILKPTELDDVSLRAAISPKVGVFKGGIVDVLPVTDFQSLSITATMFESRWMLNYFYLDGAGPLDVRRLRESFLRVVDAFDILRTVFVCFHGQFFQVVLRKVRPDIFIHETEQSLDEYTKYLQQRDRDQPPRQGEQNVHFYVVRKVNSDEHRILIRMSHAQFDGVCLPKIMTAIKMGYEGSPVPPASPFFNYMRLLPATITPEHYQHWSSLLKGSKMTEVIQRDTPNTFQHVGGFAEQKRVIEIPSAATGNVTVATVMQSAWATTLAKLSGQDDVVFGLTVNGRNATIPGIESTIGPCLNIIPVRVKFRDHWTALDLFRYLQDQHVANMPYESLGFREIIRRCTDWSDSTFFTTSVFHQNVAYEGEIQLDRNNYRMGGLGVIDNLADLTLVSKPVLGQPNKITVSLGYSRKGPIDPAFVGKVLDMVCDTAQSLVANPNITLPSPSTLRSLPPQLIDGSSSSSTTQNNNTLFSSPLNNRNLSEILAHSSLLTQIWQQVLPPNQNTGKPHPSFQLDSSFFQLGGDIVNVAQAIWLIEQETTFHVRLEDLLENPTFLGQMAVLASHTAKHEPEPPRSRAQAEVEIEGRPGSGSAVVSGQDVSSVPSSLHGKSEQWGPLDRAKTLARKLTRLGGLSTRV